LRKVFSAHFSSPKPFSVVAFSVSGAASTLVRRNFDNFEGDRDITAPGKPKRGYHFTVKDSVTDVMLARLPPATVPKN